MVEEKCKKRIHLSFHVLFFITLVFFSSSVGKHAPFYVRKICGTNKWEKFLASFVLSYSLFFRPKLSTTSSLTLPSYVVYDSSASTFLIFPFHIFLFFSLTHFFSTLPNDKKFVSNYMMLF
jgi:hypothetical protein